MTLKIGDRVKLKTGPDDVATALVGMDIRGTIVSREHTHSDGHLLMKWDKVFNVVPGNKPGTPEEPRPWDMNACWVNAEMVEVCDA